MVNHVRYFAENAEVLALEDAFSATVETANHSARIHFALRFLARMQVDDY